ncbi:hypothetical protein PAPYR_2960 [Paratrimastix pyriformis]|uniref:Uncharacterized protein n=1 Tax=Paratrimastix pyriformis TaxID=342808 RepID=A0ABQ8USN3_9EUKA|nr:hypothetical protein PAPYR_2960 [Paratrimastix pyriformis]
MNTRSDEGTSHSLLLSILPSCPPPEPQAQPGLTEPGKDDAIHLSDYVQLPQMQRIAEDGPDGLQAEVRLAQRLRAHLVYSDVVQVYGYHYPPEGDFPQGGIHKIHKNMRKDGCVFLRGPPGLQEADQKWTAIFMAFANQVPDATED